MAIIAGDICYMNPLIDINSMSLSFNEQKEARNLIKKYRPKIYIRDLSVDQRESCSVHSPPTHLLLIEGASKIELLS